MGPAQAVALLGEAVATAADRPDGPAEVLRALRVAIPFDAATIATLRDDELHLLAATGHADGIGAALRTPEYRAEHAALGMLAPGRPLRFADLPCGGATTFTAPELAWPEGLRGGLGMALHAADGREVGFLSVNTEASDGITDGHRDLVALAAGLLAHVADVPGLVARRHGGRALIGADGSVVPVPGAARVPDAGVVALARELVAHGQTRASFLRPAGRRGGRWLRVCLEPAAVAGHEHVAVLHLDEVDAPYGLTAAELRVLGLLADGRSNRAIADALVIAPGTVRTHVERVLAKLGTENRTAAAAVAVREDLRLL